MPDQVVCAPRGHIAALFLIYTGRSITKPIMERIAGSPSESRLPKLGLAKLIAAFGRLHDDMACLRRPNTSHNDIQALSVEPETIRKPLAKRRTVRILLALRVEKIPRKGITAFDEPRELFSTSFDGNGRERHPLKSPTQVGEKAPNPSRNKTTIASLSALHWYTPIRQQNRRTMNDNERNGLQEIVDKAIEDMAHETGDSFELDHLNPAELPRRTGLSRSKDRTLKAKGFRVLPHGRCGMKAEVTVISGFEGRMPWRDETIVTFDTIVAPTAYSIAAPLGAPPGAPNKPVGRTP